MGTVAVSLGYSSRVRFAAGLALALFAFVGAHVAREAARGSSTGKQDVVEPPYTPSASVAPFVSFGYREALADLLYIRLRGYFGNYRGTTGESIVSLGEATAALDPRFQHAYYFAANATTAAETGADQQAKLRAVGLLEKGISEFPDDWRMLHLAGQIYIQDLQSDDEGQRRAWRERGIQLIESAIRKPGAPVESAMWAAALRSRLGQKQRAIEGLRELLLTTSDEAARKRMIAALAKIEDADSAVVAAEVLEMRRKFEDEWKGTRPAVNASMYLLIGAPLKPGFDMTDLATGGRDLIIDTGQFEKLEPVE